MEYRIDELYYCQLCKYDTTRAVFHKNGRGYCMNHLMENWELIMGKRKTEKVINSHTPPQRLNNKKGGE